MVERVHPRVLEAPALYESVPTFPNRGRSVFNCITLARKVLVQYQLVSEVVPAHLRQNLHHQHGGAHRPDHWDAQLERIAGVVFQHRFEFGVQLLLTSF